jgi:3-deoxy-D-manno-octulosonic-acid transferase
LRALRPDLRLLLTHGTATGREAGTSLLRAGDVQAWLPFDIPGCVRRFLAQFRPALGVLMETEIWPNLLQAAHDRGVPVVLANARLSEKSRLKGQRFDALLRPAVASLTLVLAQSEDDACRLRQAGARHVGSSGNLKFDMTPEPALLAQGARWRQLLARDVVLAAVTREGEEAALLAEWSGLPEPRPLLLIVPRHPQRFDEVAGLIGVAGFTLARRSLWGETPPQDALSAQVWLGDSMREMPLYYALAKVALLGGSFAPLGGQNLIEAAACGCPLVMGPHTFNFAEAAELSLAAGAAWRVEDIAAALPAALALLETGRQREVSARALAFAARHKGAAQRMAQRIDELLRSA